MTNNKVLFFDSSISIELRKYAKGYMMPLHKHDYLTISLLIQGNLVENCETGSIQPYSGFLSIKPEGILHDDVFVNECSFLSLKIYDPKFYQLDFKNWRWIPPSAAIKYLIRIIQQPDKKSTISDFSDFLIGIENKETCPIPPWLPRVHKIICEHYREKFLIKDIAKEVGKHPFHVAKAFEKYYGVDIITYKKNLRLHQAFSDALNKKGNLTELACEYGFSDQSHFCREFKKTMQVTPRRALSLFDV